MELFPFLRGVVAISHGLYSFTYWVFPLLFASSSAQAATPSLSQTYEIYQAQQVSYQNQDWPHFFGRAQAYRLGVLKNTNSLPAPEVYDHLITLELLALGRHCQSSAISELSDWVGAFTKQTGFHPKRFHLAMASIEAAGKLPTPELSSSRESDETSVEVLWPRSADGFWKKVHHNDVVTKVENLCK